MGGGNPINDIVNSVSDAFGDAVNSVQRFVEDPIGTAFRNVNDLASKTWEAGWVKIPGTDWSVNLLGGGMLGAMGFGFALPFNYRHADEDSPTRSIGPNPYRVQMRGFVNDVKLKDIIFKTIPQAGSVEEIRTYFKQNPTYDTYDFCSDVKNSSLRVVFNDSEFRDNDGTINLEVCFLGQTDDCNCNLLESPTDIAVGFTRVDSNLTYPVAAHGMVYVGDKDRGLSTGGRCEENNISDVEKRLKNKYKTFYTTTFDDELIKEDLQKDRVLDLVYEYNGTTWIRRQNLIESVYYHTGVGDQDNALFFGGIHDSISQYTFSYNDDIASLPSAVFDEWNCQDKSDIYYNSNNNYGLSYPKDLVGSVCWQTPTWQISGNYNTTCLDIRNYFSKEITINVQQPVYGQNPFWNKEGLSDARYLLGWTYGTTTTTPSSTQDYNGCLLFNNPAYAPDSTSSINYATDPDYPTLDIIDIGENGAYSFTSCKSTKTNFRYPNSYTLQVSGESLENNIFTVTAKTENLSGALNGNFTGSVYLDSVSLEFKDKFFIYPKDVETAAISGELMEVLIKEINTNRDTVNILGTFKHNFAYTSTSATREYYSTFGFWALYFSNFDDILDSITSGAEATAIQSFVAIDSTAFAISGGSFFGTGRAKFKIHEQDGIEVGVQNKNYDWKSTLETCGQDIVSALNLNASIGTSKELRWGTPLWNRAFAQNAILTADLLFNSKIETSNTNVGNILHEITDIKVESDSIMALANKRGYISGNTKSQEHTYKALNDVYFKGFLSPFAVTYAQTTAGESYQQIPSFTINNTGCSFNFPKEIVESSVVGSIISNGASCCSGSYSFPSSSFINPRVDSRPTEQDGISYISVYWDYVDGCIWSVSDVSVIPVSGVSVNYAFNYDSSICFYSCPSTVVESLVDGIISANTCSLTGNIYNFPSDENIYQVSTGTSVLSPSANSYTRTVHHRVYDTCKVQIVNYNLIETNPISGCSFSIPSLTIKTSGYINSGGTANSIVSANVSGNIHISGSACCSGNYLFPNNFVYNSTIESISGNNRIADVVYNLFTDCTTGNEIAQMHVYIQQQYIADMYTTLISCPAGSLAVTLSGCVDKCEQTLENTSNVSFSVEPSGESYSEYATSFIQEYRSDAKNKVVENWIRSNDYNSISNNNGIFVNSNWKRWMDGVGLGGDAPNYDTIFNPKTNSAYPIINWKEVGTWNVGQIAFGTPRKSVIVGGHAVDRSAGFNLYGSGIHAAPTSKRVYVWDQTTSAPEDSYLKNYYARRFNTYYPNGTVPISSNQNLSDLNCVIFEGESDIVVERVGNAEFDGSADSITVKFDTPMDAAISTNYSVTMTCSDNVKMWWTNKTTSGFTINSEIKGWRGTVDWVATAITKVTEQDITDKGNSSGYIFEK